MGSVVVAVPVVVHHAGQQVAQHVALGQRTRVVGRVAAYLACKAQCQAKEGEWGQSRGGGDWTGCGKGEPFWVEAGRRLYICGVCLVCMFDVCVCWVCVSYRVSMRWRP